MANCPARPADAKAQLPEDLKPVKPLLDDYRQALGLAFDIDDEKGARFFRSSLVQSIFYALFAAWILWDKEAPWWLGTLGRVGGLVNDCDFIFFVF